MKALSRVVIPQAAIALILCVAAWAIDHIATSWTFSHGLPLRPIDHGSYSTIVSAIAQTLGALLGLYFTAIGVVVGGLYSKVPSDVRAVAIDERISARYLRAIALACIFAVFLASLNASRLMTTRAGLVILVVLTTYAVFAFVRLGPQVYHLLDPETLAGRLNADVYAELQQLRVERAHAWHVAFQRHHRENIEAALDTYQSLFALVTAPPPNLAGSKTLLDWLVIVWSGYIDLKSQIPATSDWYRPRAEFESILASDASTTTLHLATATMPHPRIGKDYRWFERRIAVMIVEKLAPHFENDDVNRLAELLESLEARLGTAAEQFATEEALFIERQVSDSLVLNMAAIVSRATLDSAESDTATNRARLYDSVGAAPIQILLGLSRRVATLKPDQFLQRINWTQWYRKRRFYNDRLSRELILQLEDLSERLEFELNVEDEALTADWYLRERYAAALINDVIRQVSSILERFESAFVPVVKSLANEGVDVAAIHIALRGLEGCNKLVYHGHDISEWCRNVEAQHVRTSGIVQTFDFDQVTNRARKVEEELYEHIASLAPKVFRADTTRIRALPDYFGKAYLTISSEVFDRIRNGSAGANSLLASLFGLSVLAVKRMASELSDINDVPTLVTFVTEPIVNLVELSGYVYLYAQLQANGELWRTVIGEWDDVLGAGAINAATLTATYQDALTAARPWYALRYDWQRKFSDDIRTAVNEGRWISPFLQGVAADATSWHFNLNARDVFAIVYVQHRAALANVALPHSAQSLLRSVQRANDEAANA